MPSLNQTPSTSDLLQNAWEGTSGLRDALNTALAQAAEERLILDVVACCSRAKDYLIWNGQRGAVFELIFDDFKYVGCSVLQSGENLDDALMRSLLDDRLEPKPGADGKSIDFSIDSARSKFIWMETDKSPESAKSDDLLKPPYGYIVNRLDASAKLIGKVATTEALQPQRQWRRLREVKAIAAELQKRVAQSKLQSDISAQLDRLDEGEQRRISLDQALAKSLAAQRSLNEADAK